MVEVSTSSLLMPTKYLESPNLTIGAFFVCNIWAVDEISCLHQLIVMIMQSALNHLKKRR